MDNNKDFLGTQPIGRLLLKLALPTVAAQLINMLYNIVDRMYIGHIKDVGALALTGVGVCMPLIMIISAFAALVGNGGAPRASIYMGKKDTDTAQKILGNCFSLQIILSIILTIILLIGNKTFLLAFGASENTISYAVNYMNIYAIGTIFVQLTLGMNAFITAQGFAKTGMLSVLIGAVANIVLDPVFIFGMNMGVRGAALATIISQTLSCIWVLSFLFGKKTFLKIKPENLRLHAKIILPCVALGSSLFIMQASESIISVCFNSSLLKYGGDIAVGAMTILTSVMQFAMLPLQGLAQGAQPLISQSYGKGEHDLVRKFLNWSLAAALLIELVIVVLIYGFTDTFISIFNSEHNLQLLAYAHTGLRLYFLGFLVAGINIVLVAYFSAIDRARPAVLGSVMRGIIAIAFCAILFSQILGLNGIWLSFLGSEIITFFVILIFRKS